MPAQPPDRYVVGRRLLGRAVKERRERLGLSMRELADVTGLSFGTIGSIETGRRLPSLESLDALAVAFSIPAAELLLQAWPWNGSDRPPED